VSFLAHGLVSLLGIALQGPLAGAGELADLDTWVARFERNGPAASVEDLQALETLVADLSLVATASPERREAVALALLDLASARTAEEERARLLGQEQAEEAVARATERIRDLARTPLARLLDADGGGSLVRWLATDVLVSASQPLGRRLAAVELLAGRYLAGTELALFSCAVDEQPELREAALGALAGWPSDAVHRFMLACRARLALEPGWVSHAALVRHFDAVRLDPAGAAGRELYAQASRAGVGNDWREAHRAIHLLGSLPDDPAVPALITALGTWLERRAADPRGGGSRRIEYELLRELERRSQRTLGPHPERWAAWWRAQSSGAVLDSGESSASLTRAEFFGLRPATDRVVFVIDCSGSMQADFRGTSQSRYGEARSQMQTFLRALGPEARFSVIAFSSIPEVWKDGLQSASEDHLAAAERWLAYRSPRGGTRLEPAIERALELDAEGRPDLGRLEADSVIVICDGETEGPGWIRSLLERVNHDACIAFHAVQIGPGGDGSLELLAELSGGGFTRVSE
jgi:hypothetical protein